MFKKLGTRKIAFAAKMPLDSKRETEGDPKLTWNTPVSDIREAKAGCRRLACDNLQGFDLDSFWELSAAMDAGNTPSMRTSRDLRGRGSLLEKP